MSQRGRAGATRGGRGRGAATATGKRNREEEEEDSEQSSSESGSEDDSSSYEDESEDDAPVQRRSASQAGRGRGSRGGRGGGSSQGAGRTTTTTTTTTTTSTTTANNLSTGELNKLVDEFVRYVLFIDRKKMPLTRADIVAKVLSSYRDKRIITNVFARGRSKLKDVFGYELIDVKKEKVVGSEQKEPASSTTFLLKNTLPLELLNQIAQIDPITSKELTLNHQQKALLTIILAIILLECGFIDSDQLYVYLGRLGFEVGHQHVVFGDWEKLIDKFVKELYLTRKKTEKDRVAVFQYRFGPRAFAETSKKNIIRVVGDIYGVEEIDPMILKQLEIDDGENEQQDDEEEQEFIPIVTRPSQRTQQSSQQSQPQHQQLRSNSQQYPDQIDFFISNSDEISQILVLVADQLKISTINQ
ncbi:hypothetical protein PPL_04444 [Heterostelium album PN500]|uniref:MAGE domain-containing protein n=1 Tax=Heterostelium pallidum (strain ATCC 26659 / Pp 5 / PN500) TaxID=670386 RepID=D3B7K6_HETP5|nr:hypothetical protein PPL_04444 [Heterostelium album PN500]EFA82749.1 hypothetical protein PPL_04444 [Heterostelium album PN500]|eukprot:XP_020434866.1 hypothetical protein PPL_04444 [Heterostelium album PN500]